MRERLGKISTQLKYIKIRADGLFIHSALYAGDNPGSYNERALHEDICILVEQIRQLTWEVSNNTADEDAVYREIADCAIYGHSNKGKEILRQFRDAAIEKATRQESTAPERPPEP